VRNPVSSSFAAIRDKVRDAEPLSLEDGVVLFGHPNPLEVGALANEVRERLHGDRTYFNRNLHINATNVCEASCMFCSFARLAPGDKGAYTMSLEEAWGKLRTRVEAGDPLTEIHIVNGLHPGLEFDYYTELLAGLKRIQPSIHLKAFTAVEIFYFSKKYGMSIEEVLSKLRPAQPQLRGDPPERRRPAPPAGDRLGRRREVPAAIRRDQLAPEIELPTAVNLAPIVVPRAVTTVTNAAPIRATIRAYSTIVAPSSPAASRFSSWHIVRAPGWVRAMRARPIADLPRGKHRSPTSSCQVASPVASSGRETRSPRRLVRHRGPIGEGRGTGLSRLRTGCTPAAGRRGRARSPSRRNRSGTRGRPPS
jgi:hypothetical protein